MEAGDKMQPWQGNGAQFPFFLPLMIGVISIITAVMSVIYRMCVTMYVFIRISAGRVYPCAVASPRVATVRAKVRVVI